MQAVINYLKQNQSRFIDELCEYVRFPSVSAQPQHRQDLHACAEWVVRQCQQIGLEARLCPTEGHPIVVAKTWCGQGGPASLPARPKSSELAGRDAGAPRPSRPHFLIYGHYDVQPPEPFELWESPPFEPRIEGRSLFGRGACDNKGQNLAHLKAIEAYLKTGTELPCDITLVIEGEEEVGSKSLATFLKQHQEELLCDAIVISDTGMPTPKHPALTYSLRGIAAFEVTLHGPNRDLHSGIFGGTVDNPAMALCQLIGKLRDKNGRVAIPGFYDDVQPLSAFERKQAGRLPFNAGDYRKALSAYNGGTGITRRGAPYPNQSYVDDVFRRTRKSYDFDRGARLPLRDRPQGLLREHLERRLPGPLRLHPPPRPQPLVDLLGQLTV